MSIQQGHLYWVQLPSEGQELRISHPYVVIQLDSVNQEAILMCALTTNTKKIYIPGNILLEHGEGNLPRQSIVEVSKMITIETTHLGEYIGTLSLQRVNQILAGIRFVQHSFF